MLKTHTFSTNPQPIKIRLSLQAFMTALGLFVALALLATVGKHTGLLRSFGGDMLAVVWVYYWLKTFVKAAQKAATSAT